MTKAYTPAAFEPGVQAAPPILNFKDPGEDQYGRLLRDREARLRILSKRLDLTLQASGVGSWEFHPDTGVMIWDDRMRDIFGVASMSETLGYQDFRDLLHPEDVGVVEDAMASALLETEPLRGDFRIIDGTGNVRYLRAHGIVHTLEDGERILIGANWDITDDVQAKEILRKAEERAVAQNSELIAMRAELEFQAWHDQLTGLANRRYIERNPERLFGPIAKNDTIACLHIDLDRFKAVNDTGGHAVGDQVLQSISRRLQNLCEKGEVIARIGGDEFIVLAKCGGERAAMTGLATAIVSACQEPVTVGRRSYRVGASVGVAFQIGGHSVSPVISDADMALYEAKRRGGGRYAVYSPRLRASALSEAAAVDDVLSALDKSEFVPFFQPQVDARTRKAVGAEALARWDHPALGVLAPAHFLMAVQQVGRLGDLDGMILRKALDAFEEWQRQGVPIPRISVNVSAQRLKDESFIQSLGGISFRKGTLSFELLESISFEDSDLQLAQAVEQLRKRGIQMELDDFGTGHASIVSLMDLRPDRLKIDRKLVAPIVTDAAQRRLLASIIDIAKALNIEVVAEGVETVAHADVLEALGCDVLQGYLFSRPVAAGELAMVVARIDEAAMAKG
ncbi:putative bifunctional diguanylate cyclase/phosphodiesterase [Rhizobium sp. Rhizsp42]|uniref:putative bifunctional diguanylate cyclase/phosphodiesterase n=1 Tax=Rhizobium sp. Rhizsp42 TaxID=3243034 RepID=UPI0039AED643